VFFYVLFVLCRSVYFLCVYMCTVLLPPGGYPIAVNKYVIYLYVFVCMCIFVYVCMHACLYVCVFIFLYIYLCLYMCLCVCICVCMYVCIYVFTYVCMFVFVYVCICKQVTFFFFNLSRVGTGRKYTMLCDIC